VTLTGSASAGDDILVAKSGGATLTLLDTYMNATNVFDDVQIYNSDLPSFNGDDAIELYFNGSVAEVYGVVGTDGTGESWEYTDSYAWKEADGTWTNAAVNCTDNSYYMWDANCIYPHVANQQSTGTWASVTSYSHDMSGIGQAGVWFNDAEVDMQRKTQATGSGSDTALRYIDDGSQFYSNLQIQFNSKIDMTAMNTYTMDVYIDGASLTGTQNNQLALKLQDASEAQPWTNQNTVTVDITPDVWQTVTFEFNDDLSMARDDVDRIVVQFNNEGNNDTVTGYIKNVLGSYTEPVATQYTDVTFTVNTANITVGPNGMYLGGGIFASADAHAMTDADQDGTWEVTVTLLEGTSGNYIFLNSPNDGGDWGAKENLTDQECGDPANFWDRILAPVGADDYTLQHCFASCETDGTCPAPAPVPNVCAPVPTQAEADVISVFSDAYAVNVVNNTDPNWGQNTDASVIQIGPDSDCNTLQYLGLNYQGLEYDSSDVSTMDYVHLDYFTYDSTDIRFSLISPGAENPYDIGTELGITTGQWVSVDIPLTHFTAPDLANVFQFKTEGNGDVFLDNLYFWSIADTTAPVITLVGDNPLELNNGDTYTDPGATASDDVDGDLTSSIVVGGDTVDTLTDGSYTVTYDVSDTAGNSAVQVSRVVNVSTPGPSCDHTFVMTDSFGDGWNGASVEILVGGSVVATTNGPTSGNPP
jgi:hypothetical protein